MFSSLISQTTINPPLNLLHHRPAETKQHERDDVLIHIQVFANLTVKLHLSHFKLDLLMLWDFFPRCVYSQPKMNEKWISCRTCAKRKYLAYDTWEIIVLKQNCLSPLCKCELADVNWWIIQMHYHCERKSQRISDNLPHSCSWGAHDMPAAEGLGRSAERLNTTLFLAAHRLFFLQRSLQLIRGGQNQIHPPSLKTSITHSPLATVNY